MLTAGLHYCFKTFPWAYFCSWWRRKGLDDGVWEDVWEEGGRVKGEGEGQG